MNSDEEDLYTPPRYIAVKFLDEQSRLIGEKILFAKTREGVGLRGGIHLVWKEDLRWLDRAHLNYARYHPQSCEAEKIYRAFKIT